MNLGLKRKAKLSEFTIKEYGINGGLMAIIFLFGLYLSWKLSTFAGKTYKGSSKANLHTRTDNQHGHLVSTGILPGSLPLAGAI